MTVGLCAASACRICHDRPYTEIQSCYYPNIFTVFYLFSIFSTVIIYTYSSYGKYIREYKTFDKINALIMWLLSSYKLMIKILHSNISIIESINRKILSKYVYLYFSENVFLFF